MTTILAYLDPGSSSMIVQMLLGGVAAAGVALKLYWRRFLKLLHIRKDDPEEGLYPTEADTGGQSSSRVNGTPHADAEQRPVESGKR